MFFFVSNFSVTDLAPNQLLVDLEKTLIQSTATIDCHSSDKQLKASSDLIYSSEPNSHRIHRYHTTSTSNSPSCEILKSSFISPSNSTVGDSNEKVVLNDVRPFSALYDIICKEKEIENIMSNAQQTERLLEKLSHLSMGATEQNESAKEPTMNTNTETDQPLLDRTIPSESTSQTNSKFTVAYKDRSDAESECNNRKGYVELSESADGVAVEMDAR